MLLLVLIRVGDADTDGAEGAVLGESSLTLGGSLGRKRGVVGSGTHGVGVGRVRATLHACVAVKSKRRHDGNGIV